MKKEFENLNGKEALKAENDFLKMKMMLENGAQFGSFDHPELSPEMENEFLKNVIAFEKNFEDHKKIKLFDKIEKPTIFKPVADISDEEIEGALDSLLQWLSEYNISVDVCSPNISLRELYRFITEELFEYEMDDMDLPGWTNSFIYDQFHPDPYYENESAAVDDCIKQILRKEPFDWMCHFRRDNIQLNDHYLITEEEFKMRINSFKEAYDSIECVDISEIKCEVNDAKSEVSGIFTVKLTHSDQQQLINGKWMVAFETDDCFYWYINDVQIEGINF